MELTPRAVTLTSVDAEDYTSLFAPQELVVVGGVNDALDPQPAIANQAALTVTDIATAQTAVNALTSKVNAILGALRAAGVIAA